MSLPARSIARPPARHLARPLSRVAPALTRLLPALALLVCLPGLCQAHGVFIFAWEDGERVCSESYFSKKNKVRQAEVIMADSSGEVLAKGRTDDQGLYCFARPGGAADLVFTVLAGPGHKGSFALHLDPAAKTGSEAEAAPEAGTAGAGTVADGVGATFAANGAAFGGAGESHASGGPAGTGEKTLPEEQERLLRQLVREELRAQLEPLRLALIKDRQERTPDAARIIGGLGWLAGLGALGYWLAQKRKKA